MPSATVVIIIVVLAFLGLIGLGQFLLFTDLGWSLAGPILRPDFYSQVSLPNKIYLDKTGQLEEVKTFQSEYSVGKPEISRVDEPFSVLYQTWKNAPKPPDPSGSPPSERALLSVSISKNTTITQVVWFYCSYGENRTYAVDNFVVRGGNVTRYFNDAKDEKCWDVPPPDYRDSPRLVVTSPTKTTD